MKKSENHNDSGKPIFRIKKRDFCWQKLYFTYNIIYKGMRVFWI